MTLVEHSPEILDGEPHIRGTRISVRQIVQMSEGEASPAEVAEQLQLDEAKVDAALRYYRLNRDEIQAHMEEERQLVREMLEESDPQSA